MTGPDFLTLPDGRSLEYLTGGDPDGLALVYHSGTPSAAVVDDALWGAAAAAGLRLVTYSRPGYGASTPRPEAEWPVPILEDATDTAHLLDALGIDEFLTLGWSGGGPRALACAAAMPQRCRGVVSLAGVAPYAAEGLDWFGDMGPENIRDFRLAERGREAYRPMAEEQAAELGSVTGDDLVAAFGGLVGEVDAAALAGGLADSVAASFRHAMAQGAVGVLEDGLQVVRPWGFDVAGLTVPVAVWQGANDKMVPFTHGEWLAATIPDARARLFADEGHLSLVTRMDEILADLLELAGA